MEKYFRQAVENIAAWGDTDVFPLPFENRVLFDRTDEVVELLSTVHADFEAWLDDEPPENASALAMVGYAAFRWTTQLDPLWNAYLLGLVLSLAEEIERVRVPRAQQVVFSYRFAPRDTRLWADDAWKDFNLRSVQLADDHSHIVVCDISDFYARIYHHRLENALLGLKTGADTPKRIIRILSMFSQGTSYGLPVGGPASRLLSELLLTRVDQLLLAEGITFCRFADDYHLFSDSRETAYEALLTLTDKLLHNEGLTLQKAKTRLLSGADYRRASLFIDNQSDEEDEATAPEETQRRFLSISLRYDPYSPTAKEDYETLKEQVEEFDIVGMLARELTKTQVHPSLARRLVSAIRFLDPTAKNGAARSLIDNIETLGPVFPNVMRALGDAFSDFDDATRHYVSEEVREMIARQRYYVMVPVNLAYAVRLLTHDGSEETLRLFSKLYDSADPFIQRDIMLAMGKWQAEWWLSDQKRQYSQMHPWVRRAYLVCSYVLGDEGSHWRRRIAGRLSPFDQIARTWVSQKVQEPNWKISP